MKKNKFTFEILSKYRNFIMGIATITILMFHILNNSIVFNGRLVSFPRYIFKVIGSSGVDIFLILSGIGLYYYFKKNNNLKKFYLKRYSRILIPYVIICSLAYIIRNIFFFDQGVINIIKDFFFISFFTRGSVWFWYIFALIVLYGIFPYIYNYFDSSKDDNTLFSRYIGLITFLLVSVYLLRIEVPFYYNNIQIFLLRIPAFVTGVYLGNLSYNKKEMKSGHFLALIGGVLTVFLLAKVKSIYGTRLLLTVLNMSMCIILVLIMELLSKYKVINKIITILKKSVELIGNYSLEIYLFQVILIDYFTRSNMCVCTVKNGVILVALIIILSVIFKKITNIFINMFNKKYIRN